MLQSYVLVWQEESLIQLLKNLWHHVNYVGNSYYLPSDKGHEKILWKLRGYECVERLRTTALNGSKGCFYNIKILFHNMKILAFIQFKCGFYRNQPGGMKQIIWIPFKKRFSLVLWTWQHFCIINKCIFRNKFRAKMFDEILSILLVL